MPTNPPPGYPPKPGDPPPEPQIPAAVEPTTEETENSLDDENAQE